LIVLLDINVLLDVLLDRAPWADDASALCDACHQGTCEGKVSAISVTTLFYLVRRASNLDNARRAVDLCVDAFGIVPVTRETLDYARSIPGSDLEDNVQIACALACRADAIVSRDPRGLANNHCPVMTAADVLGRLSASP
jgi:predicted nucleic acid-binding protein